MKTLLTPISDNQRHTLFGALFVCFVLSMPLASVAAQGYSHDVLELSAGVELPMERYGRGGREGLILWLPTGRGTLPAQAITARGLAERGYEVWVVNLHAAYFLAIGRGSLNAVPRRDLQVLAGKAVAAGQGRVFIMSSGRGAGLALRAARDWQTANAGETGILGLLLVHPNLYEHAPEVGELPTYLAVVGATNLPVYILQPEQSTKHHRLGAVRKALESGGAAVFSHSLTGVHDGFHLRPDDDLEPLDVKARTALPGLLSRAVSLLELTQAPSLAAPITAVVPRKAKPPRRGLLHHRGEVNPATLQLPALRGGRATLDDHRAKVVLVSFWASWCPPCVQELPSLIELHSRFRDRGLEILAVNVGESPATVRQFLREFRVRFPVLMDRGGQALKSWRVFAYPTNFLIGRDGRIRFSSYGAVDWMSAGNLEIVEALVEAPKPALRTHAPTHPALTNRSL